MCLRAEKYISKQTSIIHSKWIWVTCAGNCMDTGWLDAKEYTPSGPESLQVVVDTRQDEAGRLHPVLLANWTIKDDGMMSTVSWCSTAAAGRVLLQNTSDCFIMQMCVFLSRKYPRPESHWTSCFSAIHQSKYVRSIFFQWQTTDEKYIWGEGGLWAYITAVTVSQCLICCL